jgi:magnesium-transporting ATPase (P-type)
VIGATAIEDALQEGVPETIEKIRAANIALWVLTGDKVDTAVNIGFSSKLLDPDMHQILIDGNDQKALIKQIDDITRVFAQVAQEVDPTSTGNPEIEIWDTSKSAALIMTGKAIELLLEKQRGTPDTQRKLINLAGQCSVVLACRVSPAQKALLVRAASRGAQKRGGQPPVTLAIGDGANDVAMIQEARVGVGVAGREGSQAVNAADFSIAQFRFLQRLLLVHGRWNYRRMALLVLYIFYSHIIPVLCSFALNFLNGWSGTSPFFIEWILAWCVVSVGGGIDAPAGRTSWSSLASSWPR